MRSWKSYRLAKSLSEALDHLAAEPGASRVVAGGTDLLLDLQQGRQQPVNTLVDVTQIPEMTVLEVLQDFLFIGAAVPLNKILASPQVRQHAWALNEAAGLIGGPQVRNVATLGGNVVHALPAADGAIALLALGAQAQVASREGIRLVDLEELYLGPGQSALDAQKEILLGFRLPLAAAGQGSAHRRVMRPQGVAIAILNCAVWLQRDGESVADVRIAMGPAAPVPFRARETEQALRGRKPGEQVLADANHVLLSEARLRTSAHRASAEYRKSLAGVLLADAFWAAWQRTFEA